MAMAMRQWGGYELSRQLSLSMRQREIVINRVTASCGCEYEWGVHIAFFADRVKLTREQVVSLTSGESTDSCWIDPAERALITFVDALHDSAQVSDHQWAALHEHLDERQILMSACFRVGTTPSRLPPMSRGSPRGGCSRFSDYEQGPKQPITSVMSVTTLS